MSLWENSLKNINQHNYPRHYSVDDDIIKFTAKWIMKICVFITDFLAVFKTNYIFVFNHKNLFYPEQHNNLLSNYFFKLICWIFCCGQIHNNIGFEILAYLCRSFPLSKVHVQPCIIMHTHACAYIDFHAEYTYISVSLQFTFHVCFKYIAFFYK